MFVSQAEARVRDLYVTTQAGSADAAAYESAYDALSSATRRGPRTAVARAAERLQALLVQAGVPDADANEAVRALDAHLTDQAWRHRRRLQQISPEPDHPYRGPFNRKLPYWVTELAINEHYVTDDGWETRRDERGFWRVIDAAGSQRATVLSRAAAFAKLHDLRCAAFRQLVAADA